MDAKNKSYLTKDLKNYLSIAGIIIIIFSIFFINESLFEKQFIQLIPILGTVFLILAHDSFLNQKILSNRLVVWFGLISFPLYLWHWPIYSFSRILYGQPTNDIKFYGIDKINDEIKVHDRLFICNQFSLNLNDGFFSVLGPKNEIVLIHDLNRINKFKERYSEDTKDFYMEFCFSLEDIFENN